MRLTKIYTKIGDGGTTLLATGKKVSKASSRIEAYGTVDELNAVVGMLRDYIAIEMRVLPNVQLAGVEEKLLTIQNELFDLGGELSTPLENLDLERQKMVSYKEVSRLEAEMDEFNEGLPPLANFILPGGHIVNSTAHLARTVCRRAERRVVELAQDESIRDESRIYLNRLSDWFFVACRKLSAVLQVQEVLWQQHR